MKKVLVLGGTRFFGKHLVKELIKLGYEVSIATRGKSLDDFGSAIKRIVFDRNDEFSIIEKLSKETYDIVYDNLAYSSYDIEILLPNIRCNTYIVVSSSAVYEPLKGSIQEEDFDGNQIQYVNEPRNHHKYGYGKRLVEAAILQKFPNVNSILVRFPFVIGKDDYTNRLKRYVECYKGLEMMYIDNMNSKMSFIRSDEAGKFLAYLSTVEFHGAINAASDGQISMFDIFSLVQVLDHDEDTTFQEKIECFQKNRENESAPYNSVEEYQMVFDKAKSLGFHFTNIHDWIEDLITYYYKNLD